MKGGERVKERRKRDIEIGKNRKGERGEEKRGERERERVRD